MTTRRGWLLLFTVACGSGQAPLGVAPPGQQNPGPTLHTLTVAVSGSGTVSSSPSGIDCGKSCSASFAHGTSITLAAAPGAGMAFNGWGGACSGSGSCSLTLNGDLSLSAQFGPLAPPPPPPPPPPPVADECDGLKPAALPDAIVATLPQNSCLDGASDDGTGNFVLGYTAGSDITYPNYLFFTIQDGKAVRIGDTVPGGDETGTLVFSQPSGFSDFEEYPHGDSALLSYSHEGKLIRSELLTTFGAGTGFRLPSSAAGVDPSGGTAIARHVFVNGDWQTTYQRIDQTGAHEMDEVIVDHENRDVAAIGVALSGHALLVASTGEGTYAARWLNKDGSALTGWFAVAGPRFPQLHFLMDGGLALGFGTWHSVTWKYRIGDGVASADPLPDWLQQRASNSFFAIRNGKGYASMGFGGQCTDGRAPTGVEILAASSGKSCGCLSVPGVTLWTTVGRDGSLIVPGGIQQFGTCHFALYPQLLK